MFTPRRVTVGMSAFRATCTKVTRVGRSPFARAVRDEIGPQHLEHADAQAPDQHGDDGEGGAEPGQHERVEVLPKPVP